MSESSWFICENGNCDYAVRILAPSHVTTSENPCPKCGGKLIRKES